MRRRGISIVELVVMSGVGAVVLAGAYLLFSASSRSGSRMEDRLRAVHAAQVLMGYLSDDLKSAVADSPRSVRVDSVSGGRRNRLTVEVHDPGGESSTSTRKVVYLFDPERGTVFRDERAIAPGSFADVRFLLTRARPSMDPPSYGDSLTAVITTASPEALASPEPLEARDQASFVQTIVLSPRRESPASATWAANVY